MIQHELFQIECLAAAPQVEYFMQPWNGISLGLHILVWIIEFMASVVLFT